MYALSKFSDMAYSGKIQVLPPDACFWVYDGKSSNKMICQNTEV